MTLRLALILVLSSAIGLAQEKSIDFRYSPAHYFTAVCFPDDWQKTVVTQSGTIGDDFGPGPYAVPLTEIGLGISNGHLSLVRQHLESARVPILVSEFSAGGVTLRQHIFAIPPPHPYLPPTIEAGRVTRIEGLNGAIAWASPGGKVDQAFRNAAWGVNCPIRYRVTVAGGARKLVALGFCEPYKWGPGTRTFDVRVEGAMPVAFDPMQSAEKNIPRVLLIHGSDSNNDGVLSIEIHSALASPDPNVFLNAFWIFPDTASWAPDQIIRGDASSSAELYYPCGPENETWGSNVRTDAILGEFSGSQASPVVTLKTSRRLSFDPTTGRVLSGGKPYIISRPQGLGLLRRDSAWQLELPVGTKKVEVLVVHGLATKDSPPVIPDLDKSLRAAREYWQRGSPLPYGKIEVPDKKVQFLLDANIRTLYQVRERVDGILQFQPGPSVYRGLWVHDDVWHLTVALMLGDTAGALQTINAIARYQEPSGQVKVLTPTTMIRETPLFIYHLCRYAEVTGDTAWLSHQWWRIVRGFEWLKSERMNTMTEPRSVSYGLLPAGFADGGLGGMHPEYSSVYWSLVGLRTAIRSARLLQKTEDACQWQMLYDELLASFRLAASRDVRRDALGNLYLPIMVGDTSSTTPPQRAQWGILEAQIYGHIFDRGDSLMTGTLSMLDGGTAEGLPVNTGWLKNGVWPFFAGFYGMAHIWQGNMKRAGEILYACADHACPLGTWVEEQLPRETGTRTTGDGSDASASAQFIMLVSNLLACERDSTLELLAGLPDRWIRPDASLTLNDVWTRFGHLSLHFSVSAGGREFVLSVKPIRGDGKGGGPTLYLEAFRREGFHDMNGNTLPERIEGSWGKEMIVRGTRQ